MAGAKHRIKGARIERELVALHKTLGIAAERVPLSGASQYQGNHEDIDVLIGEDTLHCQVKAMSSPRGLKGVLEALGDADLLFYRFDRMAGEAHPRPPLIVMPWATYERLIK